MLERLNHAYTAVVRVTEHVHRHLAVGDVLYLLTVAAKCVVLLQRLPKVLVVGYDSIMHQGDLSVVADVRVGHHVKVVAVNVLRKVAVPAVGDGACALEFAYLGGLLYLVNMPGGLDDVNLVTIDDPHARGMSSVQGLLYLQAVEQER